MKARQIATAPWRGMKTLSAMVFRRHSWRGWALPRSRFNFLAEVGDGTGSSTVMAPLLWIGRNFPEAPVNVWKSMGDGQEEQVAHHDMLRLLTRPNPYYSGAVLWMATMAAWYVDGNAYWLKIRDAGGRVRELWWVPSSIMEAKGSEGEFISHYEYRPNGIAIPIEPEDVVHFRYGLDPDDQRHGLSPLKSVLREVFTDDEAANFTASLLRNMGVPGLIVSPEGDNSPAPDDVKATKEFVRTAFAADKRGEPLVMSGPTKVEQFGFNPQQLDLKALRRIPEERVTACLGVPAIVAGLGAGLDRSTFANFGEAREAAYEENIIPAQRIIGEDLRFQLLTDFENDPFMFRVGFDTTKVRVLQEDEVKRATRVGQNLKDGIIMRSEARRALGYEATPVDDVYLMPLSVIEVEPGQARADDAPPKARLKGAKTYQSRLIDALDRDVDRLTDVFTSELATKFDDLGKRAQQIATAVIGDSDTGKGLKASSESLSDQIADRLQLAKWADDDYAPAVTRHYARTADKTVETINQTLDLGVDLPDEVQQEILRAGGTNAGLVDVEGETRDALLRSIDAGREAGDGPIEIARRIRNDVPKGRFTNAGAKYRAELIARAETKNAQNVSSLKAYSASDSVTGIRIFDARIDGDHDPECEARADTVVSVDEAEDEDLTHPNCSLSFAPEIAEQINR